MNKMERAHALKKDIDKALKQLSGKHYDGHFLVVAVTPDGVVSKKTSRKLEVMAELKKEAMLRCTRTSS